VIRPIHDFCSPECGHNDVSEYESLISISLNAVLPKLPNNHDRVHSFCSVYLYQNKKGRRPNVKSVTSDY
jgi:hypothetical protein